MLKIRSAIVFGSVLLSIKTRVSKCWITEEVRRLMRARNYLEKSSGELGTPWTESASGGCFNLVKKQLMDAKVDHFEGSPE